MIQFYIEDYFRAGRAEVLIPYVSRVAFLLRWTERTRYFTPRSRGTSLYDLINEGIYNAMPRTRRQPSKPADNQHIPRGNRTETTIIWCNVSLGDDDVAYLEQQTTTYEELGALLLAVADEGYGFSVKALDKGDTIMCAIMGNADNNPEVSMGVSAFSPTVRDAVLACLYKFKQSLGGVFTDGLGNTSGTKRRFR